MAMGKLRDFKSQDFSKREYIDEKLLLYNEGQIEGVPANPRLIRDSRYEALKKSITDDPEYMTYRELIVMPFGDKYVTLAGNQRLRCCRELGYKEIPCKVLPEDTPPLKQRAYATKDNISFGQDDYGKLLAWDREELVEWGKELKDSDLGKMDADEYEEMFNGIKDDDAIYPVIPKLDDNKELIIIVSDSDVNANHVRELLGMNKMKSYKSDRVEKSNVISISDFLKRWNDRNSNTKP